MSTKKYVCSGMTYEVEETELSTGKPGLLVRAPDGLGTIKYAITDQVCALPMTIGSAAQIAEAEDSGRGGTDGMVLQETAVVAAAYLLGIEHPRAAGEAAA